ncbi:hypothetical protein ACLEJQ_22195 [Pseudomonas sp. SMV71]|uniref:hypothetical protein n=1 Tax=Pseudomonas sp. SMV71 TaxID=3390195 RepID=UPI003F83844A
MTIDKAKLTGLMRQCQRGVPGTGRAIEAANNLLALCYSSIEPLIAEIKSTESRLHDVAVLCAQVEQDRDQLKAESEALRKDAERYRWLRDSSQYDWDVSYGKLELRIETPHYDSGDLDACIDAAMGKEVQP